MKTWQNSIENVLHAHSRAITDINFSLHDPDILATCAVDSFVHCWDLRAPARPVISFSDWFAGATQVKWNRQISHVIASSHDRFLQIWDKRNGAYPVRTIEAHSTKIYGLDWNRTRPDALVTCSLDKTIKFWNCSVEGDLPERVIHTPFPVWRARHTPFGRGVLAMPQRGNGDLHLYSQFPTEGDEDGVQVHSFSGHKGQVKEFLWRPRGAVIDRLDHREFQLVSWGTDRDLRLHRISQQVLVAVGYEKGKSVYPSVNYPRHGAIYKTFRDEHPEHISSGMFESQDTNLPRTQPAEHHRIHSNVGIGMGNVSMPYARGWTQGGNMGSRIGMHGKSTLRADMNPIAWMRGVRISGWDVETLGDEISHVGEKFTKVEFEFVNVGQRKATVSMHGPWGPEGGSVFLKIDIRFPPEYPGAAVPVFVIQKTAAVTAGLVKTITSGLRKISETYLLRKRGCLEGVLRYLLGELSVEDSIAWALREAAEPIKSPGLLEDDDTSDEDDEDGLHRQDLGLSSSELRQGNPPPEPYRTCGALWTNDGRLVCFFPPKKEKGVAFVDSMSFSEMARLSRSDRVFEGFGRFQTSSPGPRHPAGTGTGTVTVTDDGASDYSDDSSNESSSSSGSSDPDLLGSLPQFQGPNAWRSGSLGFYRSRSEDNSQKSTTGVGTVKSPSDGHHNTVCIYDLRDLLPAKRDLAEQYQILGNRPDVCEHNMAVAANSGNTDLAHVWGLIKLMLQNRITVESTQDEDLLAVARRARSDIKRKDSGVDLSYDNENKNDSWMRFRHGKIRWGEHPLGGRWLVPAL
jgi:hypothetical protein